ncbi:MAG: F0F1 ATP synthase subunit delta [Epsilonproteobacteria bacterium]|nr:F0F1 ATP synthase subunit delta [Campylobacterota bacterium]
MSGAIAKKYVNALIGSCNDAELVEITTSLVQLEAAFHLEKFNHIILSPDVNVQAKESLVLSLVENGSDKLKNFMKIVSRNDRLSLIPLMAKELKYQLSLKNNTYEGKILTNFAVSPSQVGELESNFSKKFNATIKLAAQQEQYPGIKIELDDLGVEVSFSLERLKAQMTEHILKAI